MQPDLKIIQSHLNELFGDIREHDDGLIEIAYTPSETGAVNKASFFTIDDIEKAAKFAYDKNLQKGVNIYVGAALRKPETPPFGRSSINDYYASPYIWCDLDDAEAAINAKEKYSKLPPSFIVVTGRTPNLRAQAWWRLAVEEQDTENLKYNLDFACRALSGDPAVVDPTRVMRIAGSVAWPKKDGRVAELTEFIKPKNATNIVFGERFQEYFEVSNDTKKDRSATQKKRTSFTDRLKINELLDRTKIAGHWHVNMRDAVASMVGRGWEEEQIRLICAPYCDNGAYDPDLNDLLYTAKKKYSAGEVDQINPQTGENLEDKPLLSQWVASERFKGQAPEMEWLVEGIFPLGVPALLAAMGGLGKSFSILDMCIKIASPPGLTPHKAFGGNIMTRGKIVYFSAEDSQSAIHRRINKLVNDTELEATKKNLHILPMPDIGPELFISEDKDGIYTTPFYRKMMNEMKNIEGKIVLIAIDPMQAFVGADITSRPEAGQFVWTSFSNMAAITGATVLFSHHMRKDGLKTIKTVADAREAIRGSTALVDGSRLTYAMWQANDEIGRGVSEKLNLDYAPEKIVQGAVVKTNDEADQQIHTYIREDTGILKDRGVISLDDVTQMGLSNEQAANALREIRMRWEEGKPLRASPQSPHCVVKWLMKTFRISRDAARWQRDNWLCPPLGSTPLIEERVFKDEKRRDRDGLFVINIP